MRRTLHAAGMLLAAASSAAAASVLKVLPLGDSITHGCGSTSTGPLWPAPCTALDGGYRWPLLQNLTANGASIQFVGSQLAGPAAMPAAQTRHEGHPGWRIAQLTAINGTWAAFAPDIILIHLGTNDVGQNHTLGEMLTDMSALLTLINSRLPNARVLLATVLAMVNSENPQWVPAVDAYNAALPGLAARFPRVTLVDLHRETGLCDGYSGSSPTSSLCCNCNAPGLPICPPHGYDRVHPTAAGYEIMGDAWAAALLPMVREAQRQQA